jgi:RNA polymerase sigma-70 factor (ECF subfamily)
MPEGPELTQAENLEEYAVKTFDGQRARLFAIAYRMLGSASDAQDILQEAFLRWRQTSQSKITSPEAYLVTIVSRLCINHLQSSRVQREQYLGPWLPEPVLTDRAPDPYFLFEMSESISLAFLTLLERLSPMERAVFLLREVFDYEYAEIGSILEQNASNCRQILRRARQHLKEARPRFSTSPQQRQELMQRFVRASQAGDLEGLLALFSKDIVLYADGGGKATAVPNPIHGAVHVARFVVGARKKLLPAELVSRMAQVNGQPGVVSYMQGRPHSVLSIEVADGEIRSIFIVSNPDKLTGLATALPAATC